MRSQIVKHSVVINGRKTSLSLERPIFEALKEIADRRSVALTFLVSEINAGRWRPETYNKNLSSACRMHVFFDQRSRLKAMAA